MMIIVNIVLFLYGLLTLIAGIMAFKQSSHPIFIMFMLGGLLLILCAFYFNIYVLIISLIFLIFIGALNGIRQKSFHLSHIIIRTVLSIIVVIAAILLNS